MKLRTIIAMGAVSLMPITTNAIKAYDGVLTHTQPDGQTVEYRLVGDEHCHAMVSLDGYQLVDDGGGMLCYAVTEADGRLRSSGVSASSRCVEGISKLDIASMRSPQRAMSLDGFPTVGDMRGLILLVNFTDAQMQPQHDAAAFGSVMNDAGCTLFGSTGSARDYFVDQSSGLFTPTFDVFGPIDLAHSFGYYGANDGFGNDYMAHNMIVDACKAAHDDLGVDFTPYDYNADGILDFVYVIYAGYAESYGASSNTIWPHASDLTSHGVALEIDGLKVGRYACSSELKYTQGTKLEGIGTFCHEFGHVLGLPDMYNTFSTSYAQLGAWDVMDQGSYNNESHTPPSYSAFERYSLGWLDFTVIDEPAWGMELPELTESNYAMLVPTSRPNEYFTLENRQQRGWDAYQPGTGLMVIHVDYDHSIWNQNGVNSGTHPRYDLVEADGTQGAGEASDLFPGTKGITMLTDFTRPSMLQHDGTPTGKGLTRIVEADGLITFDFMHDRLDAPADLALTDISHCCFALAWQPVDRAASYRISVDEVIDEASNPVAIFEDFSGMIDGGYPKSDFTDVSGDLDKYMQQPGWTGSDLYQCGGEVRIGSYGVSGSLQSPLLMLGADGQITVALRVRSYTGKKVDYVVDIVGEQGQVMHTQSLNANKEQRDVVLRFQACEEQARLRITTDKERLFVDQLTVLRGDFADEEVWSAGALHLDIKDIEDTACKVEGLSPETSYVVKVKAVAEEELMSSDWSEVIDVCTLPMAGISPAIVDAEAQGVTYDLQGRRTNRTKGLLIRDRELIFGR